VLDGKVFGRRARCEGADIGVMGDFMRYTGNRRQRAGRIPSPLRPEPYGWTLRYTKQHEILLRVLAAATGQTEE